jgi:hypothetical protein
MIVLSLILLLVGYLLGVGPLVTVGWVLLAVGLVLLLLGYAGRPVGGRNWY